MKKHWKKVVAFLTAVIMLVVMVPFLGLASAEETEPEVDQTSPLSVEVTTEKSKYTLLSIIGFNVRITNNSDTDIENIDVVAQLGQDLVFVNGSETTTSKDSLAPGEVYEWSYKAKVSRDRLKKADKLLVPLAFMRDIFIWDSINIDPELSEHSQESKASTRANLISAYSNEYLSDSTVRVFYDRKQSITNDYQSVILELEKIKNLNNGNLPEITYDERNGTVSFIDGTYSDMVVTDFNSAAQSLNDIKSLMGFNNPYENFRKKALTQDEQYGVNHYKLQQHYKNIPVYANEVIVTTDSKGNIVCFSGKYTNNISISITPKISEQQAIKIVSNEYEGKTVNSNGLCIYTLTDKNNLVYAIEIGEQFGDNFFVDKTIFVSAEQGNIVSSSTKNRNEALTGRGIDLSGVEREFVVEKEESTYYMTDLSNGIYIWTYNNSDNNAEQITSANNTWDNRDSVSIMNNLSYAVKYYKNILKTNAFKDRNLSKIYGCVQYKKNLNNAYSSTTDDKEITILRFGDSKPRVNCLDTVAHEFTHSIVASTCAFEYLNQSGALDESYADILGNLIENDNDEVWLHGEDHTKGGIRNLTNPNEFNQPAKINDKYMHTYCNKNHDHSNSNCDYGGVHTNSGIVNHAAYLMWKNGIKNKITLAKIFSKSMDYMVSTSDFLDCRAAVLRAARDINLTTDEITVIANAFSEVGIKRPVISSRIGNLIGKIMDSETNEGICDVKITARQIIAGSESMREIPTYTNTNGEFALLLPNGIFNLTISIGGYETCVIKDIKIDNMYKKTYMEPVYLTPKNTETPVEPSIPSTAVEFNGHYYQVYDTPMTWDEAKAYCESLGGHLATITSAEENNFIKDLVSSGTKNVYWLGASDAEQEGVWKWVTSEPFEFTNWSYGEPNDDGEISTPEDYLEMYKSSGKWNDGEIDGDPNGYGGKCSLANHGLICEWDTDVKPTGTCITQMEIVDHGQYTGNQGDSRVFHLDKSGLAGNDNRYYGNGNIGLDGTEYNNGLEVWIARWNFREEISWAYATYKLDGKYTRLTGKTSLIKSANTDNFDTTIYFYNGDTLLQSYTLTNEDYEKQIDVDVSGVNELKILVQDNKAVKRGTSFALYDMFLK